MQQTKIDAIKMTRLAAKFTLDSAGCRHRATVNRYRRYGWRWWWWDLENKTVWWWRQVLLLQCHCWAAVTCACPIFESTTTLWVFIVCIVYSHIHIPSKSPEYARAELIYPPAERKFPSERVEPGVGHGTHQSSSADSLSVRQYRREYRPGRRFEQVSLVRHELDGHRIATADNSPTISTEPWYALKSPCRGIVATFRIMIGLSIRALNACDQFLFIYAKNWNHFGSVKYSSS